MRGHQLTDLAVFIINFGSSAIGPAIFEENTLESSLMTDKILGMNMKIETVSHAGLPKSWF